MVSLRGEAASADKDPEVAVATFFAGFLFFATTTFEFETAFELEFEPMYRFTET